MKRKVLFTSLCLWSLLGIYVPANAQDNSDALIWGSVEDAFLQVPLLGVHVRLLNAADSTVIMDTVKVRKMTDKNGRLTEAQMFFKVKSGKYLFHGRLEGYDDGWLSFEALGGNGINKLSPLQLRKMSTINLDDVAVTATKVKMFYKGDTIVYNADAFNLPEGSMLDELIQQLPGVTMNKAGEIFVNGRKVMSCCLASEVSSEATARYS